MIFTTDGIPGVTLSAEFISANIGYVYLGETYNNGQLSGYTVIDLETAVKRRKIKKALRQNDGLEQFDHIIDSVDIGDEAVRRGLMTDAEARIDNS